MAQQDVGAFFGNQFTVNYKIEPIDSDYSRIIYRDKDASPYITRTRGDTHRQKFVLTVTEDSVTSILDLGTVTRVEFSFNKKGVVIVKECFMDDDLLSGICHNEFTDTDVDTVGTFPYDIQVYWVDGTRTTFAVSEIVFLDDVNKT